MTQARLELTRVEETSERRPALIPPQLGHASFVTGAAVGCPGRESELAQLEQAARSISREQLVLVEGTTGIGKSRLLGELRSRVRLDGGVVLEGRCEPGRAFGPFAEIVDRALRFLDEVGASQRPGAVRSLDGLGCGHGCHRLWHQHADATASARIDDGSGASPETIAFERKMRFFDSVAGLLREVSAVRPPVVLLHQLERADEGTLELLTFLVDGGALVGPRPSAAAPGLRALFVGTLRSDAGTGVRAYIEQLQGLSACQRMLLGPLDSAGLRAYLTSDETIERLLARTGGNPDILDLLLEADPLTQRSRVERRLSRLDDEGRALLDALAVLGRPATLESLTRVAALEPAAIHALRAGRAAFAGCDLVSRTLLDGEVRFVFEREAQRIEVYALIGTAARREMHARAVEVCAEEFAREDAVRHAISTGDVERASALALAAAASLSARHAHTEAAALLESLVAVAPNAPREIRVELIDLHRVAGNYRAAIVHARALAEGAPDDARDAARFGHLLLVAGELAPAQLELARALTLAEAQVLAGDAAAPMLVTELQSQLAELLYRRGRYAEAHGWAERALDAARASGAARIEVQARNILGKLALAQKEPEHAAQLFEENQAHARHAGLAHLEAQALTNLAIAHLLRNDLGAAEEHCLRAIDLATLASDTRDRAIATENLAVLAHLRREYDRALEHYLTAVKLLKRLGNRSMLVRLARNLGELYLSLGDRESARSFCDHAAHLAGPGTPPPVTAERLVLRGRIEAAEGNTDAARAAFEGVVEIYEELGDVRVIDVRLELAMVAITDGDLGNARRMLAQVPPQDGKRGAQLAYVEALLERAHGGDAIAAAQSAVLSAERNGDDEKLLPALALLATVLLDAEETGLAARALERAQAADERLSRHVPREAAAGWAERTIRVELGALATRLAAAAPVRRDSTLPTRHSTPGNVGAPSLRPRERRHHAIVGSSPGVQQVLSVIEKVAPHDTIVLVRGESGTGKELVAEAIHNGSSRAGKPLVKVNCAALVETLLLSELFGHERGAFTGAQARKKGRFELADGGTLFLDEIGDISPKTQVALLRVLQEREFERVGGTQPIRVDVRIVCATHRDLEKMVREGSFREDLYYRLRGVTIDMPALRRRLSDLPALAQRLLGRIAEERSEAPKSLTDAALSLLAQHRWPGNVRELENVLRSATLFAEADVLDAADLGAFAECVLPAEARVEGGAAAGEGVVGTDIEHLVYERVRQGATSLFEMKKNLERECIVRALEETNGNITRAASLLGMKRPRLSQLVKEYELGDLGK